MAEYIERDKALNVCEMHYNHCISMQDWRGDTIAWNIGADIKTIPAADVVEVVRCKDCKHWWAENELCGNPDCCAEYRAVVEAPATHFCGYGERKAYNG